MCELTSEPTARIVSSKTWTLAPRLLSKRRRVEKGEEELLPLFFAALPLLPLPPPPLPLPLPPPLPSPSKREVPAAGSSSLLDAQATVPSSLSTSPSISAVVIASSLVSAIPPCESAPEHESGFRSSRGKARSR